MQGQALSFDSTDHPTEAGQMVAEQTGPQTGLQVSVVPVPAEDDQVIEEHGARVFLEPQVASLLDDRVLDASIEQGHVAFTFAEQIEE